MGAEHGLMGFDREQRLERVRVLIAELNAEREWLEELGRRPSPEPVPVPEPISLKPINTVDQVAQFTQVSLPTIKRAVASGGIESLRAGRGVRITDHAVWRWLKQEGSA